MKHVKGEKYNLLADVIFRPFAWLGGAFLAVNNFLRSHGFLQTVEPPLPLISVGNLTYGGTNKTPFVEMLAKFALSHGIKTGIVTRGYSGKTQNAILIHNGEGKRDIIGDEPLLLSRELPDVPIAIAKKRIDGVKALKNCGCELVIADDAFQHKILGRDVDIVLIDSVCPFGNEKILPDGIMREKISALSRADIVVLTKSEQVTNQELEILRERVSKYIDSSKIFTSRLDLTEWILRGTDSKPARDSKVFAFSAIGSPESFKRSLIQMGLAITGEKIFRDHHKYSCQDIQELCRLAREAKSDFITCTEKDLYNFPENFTWPDEIALVIPKVKSVLNEPEKFFAALTQALRPKIIIASNGYGEDAIGAMLAKKLREKLPESKISAFVLVGRGDAYIKSGFEVESAQSVTPSGGVLKYSIKDLWRDVRAGLLKQVRAQLMDWQKISHRIRTPICAGDVYLLLNTLLGSGARPLFLATAKTVYLSGHWRLERAIINKFTLRTWARDSKSAEQLGNKAIYSGSPIMDLLSGNEILQDSDKKNIILLLPGSRSRACKDVKLLLDSVEILQASTSDYKFKMVLAPTLPLDEFFGSCESYGWNVNKDSLTRNNIIISLKYDSVAKNTNGVKILLGLGGTANQLCAGLGIPVISIDEKGKRVQKKLLGDSEILTEKNADSLANAALRVLNDSKLYDFMSSAGRERMGSPGALDDIVKFACENLGWEIRERVYKRLTPNS